MGRLPWDLAPTILGCARHSKFTLSTQKGLLHQLSDAIDILLVKYAAPWHAAALSNAEILDHLSMDGLSAQSECL